MAKKYYVVWEGRSTGIFTDWVACSEAIKGVKQAKYKAYKSQEEATKAFEEGYKDHWGKGDAGLKFYTTQELEAIGIPVVPSLYLHSSLDQLTKIMTYKGVDTQSAEVLFRQGPFQDCDQHVGEYLALVHALAYLYQQGSEIPIYSRSSVAMTWVQQGKRYRGHLPPTKNNEKVFELIKRANKWLAEHEYKNPILPWNKRAWGHPGALLVDLQNRDPQVGQKL